MNLKYQLILPFIFLLGVNTSVFSQQAKSLDLSLNNWGGERISLDYRMPLSEIYMFSAGLAMGWEDRLSSPRLVEASETHELRRNLSSNIQFYDLRLGIEKRIKQSFFYLNSKLVVGYSQRETYEYNTFSEYIEDENGWRYWAVTGRPENEIHFTEDFSTQLVKIRRHGLRTGIQVFLSANIPIKNRLSLNVHAGIHGGTHLDIGRSVELNYSGEEVNLTDFHGFEVDPILGAGLRYELGKKIKGH